MGGMALWEEGLVKGKAQSPTLECDHDRQDLST